LKRIWFVSGLFVLLNSCNSSSPATGEEKDSLHYKVPAPAQMDAATKKKYNDQLSAFFDSALIGKGFNGGILVAKDGNILYEKYSGYRDFRSKEPLTDTTSFHLASTSKPFTGMSVLWLVQQNKLSLDDSLQKFFPGLPYPGVTVKMMLSHRSGLPNYVYFMDDKKKWDHAKYVTNEDMLQFLYTEKPNRSSAPGTRFSYCNTNYVLLAMIVEKVTGKKFPDFLQETIFVPLQMKHTYVFTLKDSLTATPSFEPRGGVWKNDFLEGTYGDKNIYSTPQDMLKWDQVLYTGQFIRQSLLDSAFTPQSLERPSVHNYGLGWRLLMLPNGKKVVYHFGRWHGFTPAFARLIDEKATIIILGNKFNRSIYNAAHKAYDLFGDYLQHRSDDAGEETETPPEPERKKVPERTNKKAAVKKTPAKKAPAPPKKRR